MTEQSQATGKAKGTSASRQKGNMKKTRPGKQAIRDGFNNETESTPHLSVQKGDIALTVRVEINLPAGDSQETYDAIFKSIKTNLYL